MSLRKDVTMPDKELLNSLAAIVADYRKDEIAPIDSAHIRAWVSQFEPNVQDVLLKEMHHVLQKSYFSKKKVRGFLKRLAANEKITNGNPKKFWKRATILNIQRAGSSQKEMLETFDPILKEEHGYGVTDCAAESETAIYIDDVIFSGGHVRGDLINWIAERAPKSVQIYIIALALHEGGRYYAHEKI